MCSLTLQVKTTFIKINKNLKVDVQYLPLSGNNIIIIQTINETFDIYPTCQVFNKLLSLANSAAQPKADYSLWTNLLLSTSGVRL